MSEQSTPLVVHVIHHLVIGGMENGLVNIINRMTGFRHAIVCVENYSDFRQRITRDDVEVFAMHRSRIGVWGLRRALHRLFRELRPSIVHSRNMSGLDALLPAVLAGVRRRVHGEHGWDVSDLNGEKFKPALLRRVHSPLVTRYITVSKQLEQYLTNRVGIRAARITQIYNGVDTIRFAPRPHNRRDIFPEQFADEHSVIIGTVGRIQPVKNQTLLLRAFAAMIARDATLAARARLAIIGDGPLFAELRELASSLGIASRVWMPGARSDVADILPAFDVFVLPSLSEGISNTILEAAACGIPVLASAVGGNVELIESGRNGDLFPSEDADALAQLLARYVADDARRKKEGVQARELTVQKFSIDSMVANYRRVYEQLCATR